MPHREHYETILEAIQDVVWSYSVPEGRVIYMNSLATLSLYGRSPEEFYEDPRLWLDAAHPDDQAQVMTIPERVERGEAEDFYRIVRADSEVRWVHSRAWCTRGPDGKPERHEGVIRDVTDAKKAELALRENEARLNSVVRAGRAGLFEIDTSRMTAYWSKVFREILGVSPNHVSTPAEFEKLIHPDDVARASAQFREAVRGERNDLPPFRIVRPDGGIRWVQSFGHVVREGGAGGKLIGSIIDITESRESAELVELHRAKMAAAAKMSALGEMAGGLAHEINNPLAIIHGHAVLLKQLSQQGGVPSDTLAKAADTIEQTAGRISKIVKSLRAFAREGEQDPFERVTVKSIVDDTAELCKLRFRGQGIEFRIDPIDHQLKLDCRPVQISQVLLNLLNNAHDAVERLPSPWIRISAEELESHVEIHVTDCGQGIPSALREKLFQPFFTTKEIGKGTGLGLSVSNGIVETHSGSLRIDGECPNTRFVVRLPKRQKT